MTGNMLVLDRAKNADVQCSLEDDEKSERKLDLSAWETMIRTGWNSKKTRRQFNSTRGLGTRNMERMPEMRLLGGDTQIG